MRFQKIPEDSNCIYIYMNETYWNMIFTNYSIFKIVAVWILCLLIIILNLFLFKFQFRQRYINNLLYSKTMRKIIDDRVENYKIPSDLTTKLLLVRDDTQVIEYTFLSICETFLDILTMNKTNLSEILDEKKSEKTQTMEKKQKQKQKQLTVEDFILYIAVKNERALPPFQRSFKINNKKTKEHIKTLSNALNAFKDRQQFILLMLKISLMDLKLGDGIRWIDLCYLWTETNTGQINASTMNQLIDYFNPKSEIYKVLNDNKKKINAWMKNIYGNTTHLMDAMFHYINDYRRICDIFVQLP